MVKSFDEMPAVMRDRADEVGDSLTNLVKRAYLAIDREIVLGTPVDKGPARSNWVGSLNAPFSGEIPAYSPGSKLGLGERANAQAAITQATLAIAEYDAVKTRSAHLTNNVPYIEKLNSGSSAQAPAMFVQKAIQVGGASIRGAKVLKG